jgi:GSH-dependent disulfide-bond oxidoreductase
MIELYTWRTPNGRKVSIMLEEIGIPYSVHPVDLGKNEQFEPKFLAVSPNNKIPAIVDDEGPGGRISLFESGAILTYLAEKTGKLMAPIGSAARYKTLEWLNWQMGGLGPMLGQLGFFALRAPEKAPLAAERFTREAERLYNVLEKRLGEAPYLGGDAFTIADVAAYPWCYASTTFHAPVLGEKLAALPNFQRWMKAVGERPAVQRGMTIP